MAEIYTWFMSLPEIVYWIIGVVVLMILVFALEPKGYRAKYKSTPMAKFNRKD